MLTAAAAASSQQLHVATIAIIGMSLARLPESGASPPHISTNRSSFSTQSTFI